MTLPTIPAIAAPSLIDRATLPPLPVPTAPNGASFADMLSNGVDAVNNKVLEADRLVRAFTLDDSAVPVHQVTYALEQARLSLDLMMQVRSRLIDGYQQLMNMQL